MTKCRCFSVVAVSLLLVPETACNSKPQLAQEVHVAQSRPPAITDEIQLVDSQGKTRSLMSAKSGTPVVRLLQDNGASGIELSLNTKGYPIVKLTNPEANGPVAALEVDDKGAHVKLDHPGRASTYLFLNNGGESGVVFIDEKGVRRLDALVKAGGDARIQRFGQDGKLIP